MLFRKIVCVLGGGDGDSGALATAFALARPAEGHVQALSIRTDPRDAVPMLGEGLSGTLVQEIMANAEDDNRTRARTCRTLFEAERTRAGAVLADQPPGPGGLTTAWVDVTGRPEEVVARAARLADLTVFPALSGAERDMAAELEVEAALLASGRPLLLAPPVAPAAIGRSIAIAWNGGAEAARAVDAAMGLITKAETVTILVAATTKTEPGVADGLVEYLAWHGVRAGVRPVRGGADGVGAALLETAGDLDADLLVMGGYGTSRLKEMILGGVTRHVLSHADRPVLMAH
ncbi:MAG: hypothetical protein RLY86_462 [Pseudomonadota bacterium]|jgi:nucleotide-binding universal stress UspA family protein